MKLAVALAVLPAAAAFVGPAAAPAETRLRETKADLEALAKELNPTVGFYDPLGLSSQNFWGKSEEETIGFLRHAEIKHGRVAMAAFSGYVVQANGFHWPWAMTMDGRSFDVAGSPPEQWDALPAASKWQIILFVGMLELFDESVAPHYMMGRKPGMFPSFSDAYAEGEGYPHPVPFDLFDPFGSLRKMMDTEEKRARGRLVEINNGRAAMLGIFGFMSASKVPGSVPVLTFIPPYDGNYMIPFEGNFHMPSMM